MNGILKIAAVAAALATGAAFAQGNPEQVVPQPGQPPAPEPGQPPAPQAGQPPAPSAQVPAPQDEAALHVSEEELETFAEIYVDLQDTRAQYEEEVVAAETEQEAQEAQTRMQEEAMEKMNDHGWTPEEFNRVAQAVNADPELLSRALALVEEKS